MPKVTEAHTQARRQQILDAARECFSANGFHQTTMHDICHTAELSPGAVYRYFRSKEEIIEAMNEERRQQNADLIGGAFAKGETLAVFDELASAFFSMIDSPTGDLLCRLDIELWGEALRNDSLSESFRKNLATVRTLLAEIIRESQERGDVDASLDAASVARVMMAFYQGLVLQKAIDKDADVWSYVAVAKAMMGGKFWQGDNPNMANVDDALNITDH